jgi:hypothetical protein
MNSTQTENGGTVRSTDLLGVRLIEEERRRQIEAEGWSADHDDSHSDGELAMEALFWAAEGTDVAAESDGMCGTEHRKSKSRIRQLVIAGALVAAEIDRLHREQARTPNSIIEPNSVCPNPGSVGPWLPHAVLQIKRLPIPGKLSVWPNMKPGFQRARAGQKAGLPSIRPPVIRSPKRRCCPRTNRRACPSYRA